MRRHAGGEGRPHRRSIRQAAHVADGKARRRRAAGLSRRHHQRHRFHARRHAYRIRAGNWRPIGNRRRRSICLRAFANGGYASLDNVASMDAVVRQRLAAIQALSATWPTVFPGRSISCAPAGSTCGRFQTAHHRFLHQPRSAAARLRAGVHPRRFDHRRLVLHLGPHGVDRRPHPAAGSCACRILPRHQKSARA